jgi:hypothetical protein
VADSEINIDIEIHNDNRTVINQTIVQLQAVQQQVDQNSKAYDRLKAKLQQYGKSMLTAVKVTAKFTATAAAAAAATGPLTSGLLGTAKAVGAFGSSLANLTPLLAFLPSLIGSFLLIKKTAGLMGPGFAKAFEPIMLHFRNADGSASKFTQRLQAIAGIGLKPLVAEFNRVNLPAIQRGMEGIAYQLNGITNHTLRWVNSAAGQELIRNITLGTVKAMEALSPKVIRLVNAFGALAAKAGDKAIVGLGDLIGRLLDKLSAWAETKDLDDINAALNDLSGYGGKLKDTFTAIRDIGRWMGENQAKVKAFSDAVAAGAIAIGIATGNIPAVIGGAFALILNHWADLKGQFAGAGSWIGDLFNRWKNDAGRIAIAEGIMNALRNLRQGFESATKDIGPKWARFIHQVKGAWQEWAPLIATWWNTVGSVIFNLLGKALGIGLTNLLDFAAGVAATTRLVGEAFRAIIPVVLSFISTVLDGAAKAFGWVPGIGPKLQEAAREFNKFADEVNRALNRIDPVKTVRINASVYVTGNNRAAGGVDQRTGNSRNAGLSGLSSWRPAQQLAGLFAGGAAFAMAGGGGVQVSTAPVEVHNESKVSVSLDGRPFREMTVRVVDESQRREAWRARVGRRR